MWRPIVNNGANPTQCDDASACARQAGAPRQVPAHVEEAQDLHDATRQAVAHAPDHGASNPDEDGVGEEGGPGPGGGAGHGQQDAAGDVQGVVAQGIGGEALGGDEVVGSDGGGGANPSEDDNCQVRDGHG